MHTSTDEVYVAPTSAYRWWAQRYNVTNAWIFNGNNGYLNYHSVNSGTRGQAVANLLKTLNYRLRRTGIIRFL